MASEAIGLLREENDQSIDLACIKAEVAGEWTSRHQDGARLRRQSALSPEKVGFQFLLVHQVSSFRKRSGYSNEQFLKRLLSGVKSA
jgi:hypothetical protein